MMRIAVPLIPLLLAGCASYGGTEIDPVEARLNQLERDSTAISDALAAQKRRLEGLSAVGLDSSIASLEEQFRDLRGKIEQLEYETREAQERQQALYVDLDRRLQALEKGQGTASEKPAVQADNRDQKAYLAAFQQLKNGDYPASIESFGSFLQAHPDSPYAANAQYWIGEAHYVQRDFEAAWTAFATVLKAHPDSNKVPDALLKQGMVRQEQGRAQDARQLYEQLSSRFPNSSAAGLAKERLAAMGG